MFAKKISSRTGLHTELGGAYWSPWSGMILSDVTASVSEEAEPLAHFPSIHLDVYYRPLFSRQVKIKSLLVDSPSVRCSEDGLKRLVNSFRGAKPPSLKAVPAAGTTLPPKVVVRPPATTGPLTPATPPRPAPAVRPIAKLQPSSEPDLYPLLDCEVRQASFLLSSDSGAELIAVDGLDLSLPTQKRPGTLNVESVKIKGREVCSDAIFQLQKNSSGLQIEGTQVMFCGGELEGAMLLNKYHNFQGQWVWLGEGFYLDKEWGKMSCGNLASKLVFKGALKQPKSWRMVWLTQAKEVQLRHPSKTLELESLEMQLDGSLAQGLRIAHFSGTSPHLLLRGRAVIGWNGHSEGICRIMATEEEAHDIFRFAGGLRVHFPMTPLQDSGLMMNDVLVRGKLRDLEFKSSRRWKRLKQVISSAEGFLQSEGEETLRGE